jgi:hypothetical protein
LNCCPFLCRGSGITEQSCRDSIRQYCRRSVIHKGIKAERKYKYGKDATAVCKGYKNEIKRYWKNKGRDKRTC